MRRIVVIFAVIVAAVVLVVVATGSSSSGDNGYQVRAIFKNAFTLIPGEDVKVAGVVVGSIGAMDTAANGHRAAVVLDIDKAGFQDFRQDATCTIRPQSFIGERYVECSPTQPHPEGSNPSPPLPEIKSGDGKGQHLLPVTNTVTPVDLDLVNNIMRLPFRERLTVLLNEFGIGLGARGKDLSDAIRAADPALIQLDKVLKTLAGQNKILARLAVDGDRSLAPLARERQAFADSFAKENIVNQATAERSAAFQKNLQLLPTFLAQLTPTMVELKKFADQFTPTLQDLHTAAPSLNRLFQQIPAFATAGIPAVKSLGDTADVGTKALTASYPLSKDLRALGTPLVPASQNLSQLLTSIKATGGVSALLKLILNSVNSSNGYDTYGHYLRTALFTNLCTTWANVEDPKCTAHFDSVSLPGVSGTYSGTRATTVSAASATGAVDTLVSGNQAAARNGAGGGAAPDRRRAAKPSASPASPLLNYLLGDG